MNVNLLFPIIAGIIATVIHHFIPFNEWYMVILIVLSYPIKILKNRFSLFGGICDTGTMYSVIAIYQKSHIDCFAIIGLGYQQSLGHAFVVIGIIYQRARDQAIHVVGIAIQAADISIQIAGIAIQMAEKTTVNIVGICYQHSKIEAYQILGVAYQYAEDNTEQLCGIAWQCSKNIASQFIGILLLQITRIKAYQYLGLTFYRKADHFKGNGIFILQEQMLPDNVHRT